MSTDLYVAARACEGRLLPDATVAILPDVAATDPLADEWRARAESCERLLRHLRALRRPLRIVELGCGNGWLAHRLSSVPGSEVLAADVNDVELDQARRVFAARGTLRFANHDMRDGTLPGPADVVVLASALQYLPDPAPLMAAWLDEIDPRGELHVLDTPIYTQGELAAARRRTRRHYAEIGVPEMAVAYHHHTWDTFARFQLDVLFRPDAATTRLRRRLTGAPVTPFPWLRIRRDAGR